MKKKLPILLTLFLTLILSLCGLTACGENADGVKYSKIAGTYYYVDFGVCDQENWIKLNNDGTWADNSGDTGKYTFTEYDEYINVKLSVENEVLFDMKLKDGTMQDGLGMLTYMIESAIKSNGISGYHATVETSKYSRSGKTIYFGEYPQSIKNENVSVSETPNAEGYYIGSDEQRYVKATAKPFYKGDGNVIEFSNDQVIVEGQSYYFKVEPLKWRILEEVDGTALIQCSNIIWAMAFEEQFELDSSLPSDAICSYFNVSENVPSNTPANNYYYSDLRSWLNSDFFNTAFTDEQQEIILTENVENGRYSRYDYTNDLDVFNCENTLDKIFILSENQMRNSDYGFFSQINTQTYSQMGLRRLKLSDYAKITGVPFITKADVEKAPSVLHYGLATYMTRTPSEYGKGKGLYTVTETSWIGEYNMESDGISGVVPALRIKLEEPSTAGLKSALINDGKGYVIFGTENKNIETLIIPSKINGVPVTEIGKNAFSNCANLKKVVLPSTITIIDETSFINCSNLTSATIPLHLLSSFPVDTLNNIELTPSNRVTSIGERAFENCSNLTSVIIGNGIESIVDYAFYNCSLTSIEIPNSVTSIGNSAFYNCAIEKAIMPTLAIGYVINSSLKEVVLTSGTSIGSYAFSRCSLTSIEIPNSVTSIGSYAFKYCSSLTSVSIPNSVTSIGEDAFEYCSSLTKVNYTGTIDEWVQIEFTNYSSNPIYYAENLYINNELVTQANIITATKINAYAFFWCTSLISIEIPNSVTSIGNDAFEYCYKLVEVINKSTHITITKGSSSNGYVGYYAKWVYNLGDTFTGSNLTTDANGYITYTEGSDKVLIGYTGTEINLTLPSDITKINQYAFSGCSRLTSIEIPNSVTSIGNYAFYNCSSLTSIVVPNSVTSIGSYAFSGCSSLISIEIPNSVTSIGDYAFYNCSRLTSIEIPNSVTSIGERAFFDCDSLTSIEIPNSVESIGSHAFYSCDNLTSVTIGNSVTSIGRLAFASCSRLTSVTIPNSVTSIGDWAFNGCSRLKSVVIPNSVTSIGESAFEYCDNLTSITFEDTSTWYITNNEADWKNKTGGTQTDVSTPTNNDNYFKSTYCDYYWYKL